MTKHLLFIGLVLALLCSCDTYPYYEIGDSMVYQIDSPDLSSDTLLLEIVEEDGARAGKWTYIHVPPTNPHQTATYINSAEFGFFDNGIAPPRLGWEENLHLPNLINDPTMEVGDIKQKKVDIMANGEPLEYDYTITRLGDTTYKLLSRAAEVEQYKMDLGELKKDYSIIYHYSPGLGYVYLEYSTEIDARIKLISKIN